VLHEQSLRLVNDIGARLSPNQSVARGHITARCVVNVDVGAVGARVDDLLAPRSRYEDMETDYDCAESAPRSSCR
jgi:hypothetical protein